MKQQFKQVCSALLLVLLGASSFAQEGAKLAQLRSIYEDSLAKCEWQYKEGVGDWPASYAKAIATLQAKMQRAGNLDGWSATNKELTRFKEESRITDDIIEKSPAMIRGIQRDYKNRRESYDVDRCKSIISLKDKYVARLSSLQKSLTRAGKIDEAFSVRSEIERVRKSEVVTAAEFMLADYEAARPDAGRENVIAESEPADHDDEEDEPVKQTGTVVTSGGITVYPAGALPPADTKRVYRRRSLRTSPHSPPTRSVSVGTWEMTGKKTERNGSQTITLDDSFVRLSLRTTRSGLREENVRIYLQHYTKPAGAPSKKIRPSPASVKSVELPFLDNDTVYLDFPKVTAKSVRIAGRRVTGNKHYGFIVSVYDKNGGILYQGTPVSQLRDFAGAQAPGFSSVDVVRSPAARGKTGPADFTPPPEIEINEGPLAAARREFFRALNAHRANPQDQEIKKAYDLACKEFHRVRAEQRGK